MDVAPFSLTFGRVPPNYINRVDEANKLIEDFSQSVPSSYSYLIIGSRGSGKTVFMTYIAKEFSNRDDWIVVDPADKENILENIAAQIYTKGKVKHLFMDAEFNFSFNMFGFSIKGKEPITTPQTLLDRMLSYLKNKGKKVLITLDEADNSKQMKNFLSDYQYFLRQEYDIRLLMTGLYENVSRIMEDKSLTFLYRCPSIQLGPLPIAAVTANYEALLAIEHELALSLAKETKGFAFAYQLLGYLFYESEEKKITPSLLGSYDELLAKYVYEKTYIDLSVSERKIISCFKTMKPIPISVITEQTGFDTKYIGVYRNRLIKKGILFSPVHGYLALALPRFDRFLSYQDEDLLI